MEPTLAEIRLFAGNFAPRGWAFCDGQLLPISQNQALFSLLGTIYGGDGRTTFALPDLRGRAPIAPRHGPGLSDYREGQKGGVETVTLIETQIPGHNHSATPQLQTGMAGNVAPATATQAGPQTSAGTTQIPAYSQAAADTTLAGSAVTGSVALANAGGNQSHENRQPWIALNYIIALQGIFPSRS